MKKILKVFSLIVLLLVLLLIILISYIIITHKPHSDHPNCLHWALENQSKERIKVAVEFGDAFFKDYKEFYVGKEKLEPRLYITKTKTLGWPEIEVDMNAETYSFWIDVENVVDLPESFQRCLNEKKGKPVNIYIYNQKEELKRVLNCAQIRSSILEKCGRRRIDMTMQITENFLSGAEEEVR